MKEYIKPEIEKIDFATEVIASSTGDASGDTVDLSKPVQNPFG